MGVYVHTAAGERDRPGFLPWRLPLKGRKSSIRPCTMPDVPKMIINSGTEKWSSNMGLPAERQSVPFIQSSRYSCPAPEARLIVRSSRAGARGTISFVQAAAILVTVAVSRVVSGFALEPGSSVGSDPSIWIRLKVPLRHPGFAGR